MSQTNYVALTLEKIRVDGGTQTRAAIDEATAQEYADALREKQELPAADVFFDGQHYWLAAGFHRYRAHQIAEQKLMWVRVHEGGIREAILFGLVDNTRHGLRPSPKDKQRAIAILLADEEWAKWPDSKIARLVTGCESGSARTMVAEMREHLSCLVGKMREAVDGVSGIGGDKSPRKVTRNGTTYDMKTGGIGGKRPSVVADAPWLKVAIEDIERAREALLHVEAEPAGQAVLALDLAGGLVRGIVAPVG